KLCSAPILALPEGAEDFIVYCDASHKGLGVVLMKNKKVIAYASQQLKIHKKNYTTHYLELGAKELNMRRSHWLELLNDYDCKIRYHPRKSNLVVNALSKKEQIKPLRVRALVMTIGLDLPKQILNAQTKARKPENFEAEDVGGMIRKEKLEPGADETLFLKNENDSTERLTRLYLKEVVMRHGIPVSIICDSDGHVEGITLERGYHFGKQGKLNSRYIGPFKVLAKVGTVAYRLKIRQQLRGVHTTFHISNLKKCLSDKPLDEIHIDDKLHFVEEPMEIMDREVKRLKKSHISIIKV
nr:putative reverse transcriptase domain-containing protein [Tanacetum cinerariifolium]